MSKLIIVSNRVVLPQSKTARSGGLAVVLKDALKRGTIWVGWSGEINNPPQVSEASDGTVDYLVSDVTESEHAGYYNGFYNSCIYPLLLYRPDLMRFSADDYRIYKEVCVRFASLFEDRIEPNDFVWVNDNQLMGVIDPLRAKHPQLRCGFYLHLPFPSPDIMQGLPVLKEFLQSWLSYDVAGFQTKADQQNFLAACSHLDGAEIVDDEVHYRGRSCRALIDPVGIDAKSFAAAAARRSSTKAVQGLMESLAGRKLIIGAERLDYSKGLKERILAYGKLLEKYPEHLKQVSYLQIATVSRPDVAEYQVLKEILDREVGSLNGRFSDVDWVPLRYITRSLPRPELASYFRCAKVGIVTPLHDGFNLVCEEYVAAQDQADPGVLILSKFAGASDLLDAALKVNPLDTEAVAQALRDALRMPLTERRERWQALMGVISSYSAKAWSNTFLKALSAA